ncbi:MAG: hypothetical protein R3Y13_04295 [bacterium]
MKKENKLVLIEALDSIIYQVNMYKEQLNELNKDLKHNVTYVDGAYTCSGYSIAELQELEYLLDIRENLKMLLNDLPSVKSLEGIKYLVINDKEIKEKHYKLLSNLPKDEGMALGMIFQSIFNIHNREIEMLKRAEKAKKEEQIQEESVEKEEVVVEEIILKIEDELEESIEEDYQEEIEDKIESIDESSSNISDIVKYYYQLLENIENYFLAFTELNKLVENDEYKIIYELKKLLLNDYKEYSNISGREYIEEKEYNKCLSEIEIKLEIIEKLLKNQDISEEIESNNQNEENRLFFAKTKQNRVYVEDELKNIPDGYMESAYKLLNGLITNDTKGLEVKKITNNNKLSSLWELKIYKVRLYYLLLGNNNVQVIMLSMKKSTNDKLLLNQLKLRVQSVNDSYEELKDRILKDKVTPEEIEEEKEILDRIIQKMNIEEDIKKR